MASCRQDIENKDDLIKKQKEHLKQERKRTEELKHHIECYRKRIEGM